MHTTTSDPRSYGGVKRADRQTKYEVASLLDNITCATFYLPSAVVVVVVAAVAVSPSVFVVLGGVFSLLLEPPQPPNHRVKMS